MVHFVKIGSVCCLLLLYFNTAAQTVDCNNTKCIPVTVKIVGKDFALPPPTTLPAPLINLQSGQYPFGTVISFDIPVGLNIQSANTLSQLTFEYMWDFDNSWKTGTEAALKRSGTLSVRTRLGTSTSEIQKHTYQLFYKQVLLIGNSFTQHLPYEPIGWTGNWGMAASAPDKDYKSTLERYLQATYSDTKVKIFPTGRIENDFNNYDFENQLRYSKTTFQESDLIVLRFGENVKDWEIPMQDGKANKAYKETIIKFINMVRQNSSARVVITSVFWQGFPNTNAVLKEVADENGYDWVNLIEIGKDNSNYAYGLFTDPGVAMHPNDKGMKAIADLIYEKIK
ncbi:SGNH/GDSL hydrolase family protein [Runella slithyformis]|uniref:SGNH/GDSL hydrolase family protein n=1 Tax=Runella slithyformis (strain ATCC 29530 / DSM 19594 / LMG 11500 / NCIMB 11436 / LSU 4) TaxID=761193 RepID=A0A7U3ZQI8_RUNSL|nr:SGNH/GDSL hydrolase family protein [Runella slithyformis]AEI51531.1 hypothetical protein Runsl_5232 [Runella slithyformis DSM 19594]